MGYKLKPLGYRTKKLKDREEIWRLRSRAIWMHEGDENTNFYHKFSNGRKEVNTIWQLQNEQGQIVNTFPQLSELATSHFKHTYSAPRDTNLAEIIKVAQLFPRFVEQEEGDELTKEVTLKEMEATLKWFKKDKIPRPAGWSIEFYLDFFDTIGGDLLKIVEDSRIRGYLETVITSTFIALIPKIDNRVSFEDFRPISLCNYIYKIIAKIIANRMRPILSNHISREKFAFLQDRKIHEVVHMA